jgi:hypothetical protein
LLHSIDQMVPPNPTFERTPNMLAHFIQPACSPPLN